MCVLGNWVTQFGSRLKSWVSIKNAVSASDMELEVHRTDICKRRSQADWFYKYREMDSQENRLNPIFVLTSLTLVMKVSYRHQDPSSQRYTHIPHTQFWCRSQRSWGKILGKENQFQAQLLVHASKVSQQIRNVCKLLNGHYFSSALWIHQEAPRWPTLTGNIQKSKFWKM